MCTNYNDYLTEDLTENVLLIDRDDIYNQCSISTERNNCSIREIYDAYNEYKEESIYW